jgi:hypothetical protein
MNGGVKGLTAREPSLVKLYMELTGASESTARSVFMHVCCREIEDGNVTDENGINVFREEEAVRESFGWNFGDASGWLRETVATPVPA